MADSPIRLVLDPIAPSTRREPKSKIYYSVDHELAKSDVKTESVGVDLAKSLLRLLDSTSSVERLAFESDPHSTSAYAGLYKQKLRGLPEAVAKRIAIQDDLVAAIIGLRCDQLSAHGHPRPDPFSTGYVIEPNPGVVDRLTPEQKLAFDGRIEAVVKMFRDCGKTEGWSDRERCSFSHWLRLSTRNALVVGRLATEIVWQEPSEGAADDERTFHSFRAIDAGTIFQAIPMRDDAAETVRQQAQTMLDRVKGVKKVRSGKHKDLQLEDVAWYQVKDGTVLQVFTDKECAVHNFFPVSDLEMDGYPVTPLDNVITAVTTHINITQHNKLYFQTGRASRGMLVIKGEDVDENVVDRVKQQFNASINSVQNSWRMPVFGIGPNDEISWSAIDNSSRDAEFQYLTDTNVRVILTAFKVSPEELPGWAYLSRGTNNQALAESNTEYKLEAARDLGIRPLLTQFEDHINSVLFPLIDQELAHQCRFRFVGLDADTAEKQDVRIQQAMPVHMTYDQVMVKVEKQPVGRKLGGDFPLNPQFAAVLDAHMTVGEVEEYFMGREGASKDPTLAYRRDNYWFQWQQFQAEQQQAQQQAAAQQQQSGAGGGSPGAERPAPAGVSDEQQPGSPADANPEAQGDHGSEGGAPTEKEKDMAATAGAQQDLSRALDQAVEVLTKDEAQLPSSKRELLRQHRRVIEQAMSGWDEDLLVATDAILRIADAHMPVAGG